MFVIFSCHFSLPGLPLGISHHHWPGDPMWNMWENYLQSWPGAGIPVFPPGPVTVELLTEGPIGAQGNSCRQCPLQTEELHWKHFQVCWMVLLHSWAAIPVRAQIWGGGGGTNSVGQRLSLSGLKFVIIFFFFWGGGGGIKSHHLEMMFE